MNRACFPIYNTHFMMDLSSVAFLRDKLLHQFRDKTDPGRK